MSLQTATDEFMFLFKRHLNGSMQAQIRWVTCKSVDWDKKTMIADGVSDDVPYYDIALGFGSLVVKPTVGTDCLIGILEGQESVAWLMHASEAETMVFNGGDNNGLIKIKELTDKLNALKDTVNSLVSSYNTHTHTVATTGTAVAQTGTATAIVTQATQAVAFDKADYENDKITH